MLRQRREAQERKEREEREEREEGRGGHIRQQRNRPSGCLLEHGCI
jgi:hypothetical protein